MTSEYVFFVNQCCYHNEGDSGEKKTKQDEGSKIAAEPAGHLSVLRFAGHADKIVGVNGCLFTNTHFRGLAPGRFLNLPW